MDSDIAIDSVLTSMGACGGASAAGVAQPNLLEAFDRARRESEIGTSSPQSFVGKLRSKLSRSPKLRKILVTFLVTAALVLGVILFMKPPIVMRKEDGKLDVKLTLGWVVGCGLSAGILSMMNL